MPAHCQLQGHFVPPKLLPERSRRRAGLFSISQHACVFLRLRHADPWLQCCVEIPCQVGSASGYCRSVSNNACPGGTFDPGNYCPGPQDIQCCLKSSGGGGGSIPDQILAKAVTAGGTPCRNPRGSASTPGVNILRSDKALLLDAWGGGSCSGPTHDSEPYEYGEIGYDCSGLVCWAVCQVTGRNLFSEGLRVTYDMYCASESRLGYKKYPYEQRKKGDAVFFGGDCKCSTEAEREKIHHVGLMMDSGNRIWNAPNDEINRVKEMKISDFSDKPCPYVIRFA